MGGSPSRRRSTSDRALACAETLLHATDDRVAAGPYLTTGVGEALQGRLTGEPTASLRGSSDVASSETAGAAERSTTKRPREAMIRTTRHGTSNGSNASTNTGMHQSTSRHRLRDTAEVLLDCRTHGAEVRSGRLLLVVLLGEVLVPLDAANKSAGGATRQKATDTTYQSSTLTSRKTAKNATRDTQRDTTRHGTCKRSQARARGTAQSTLTRLTMPGTFGCPETSTDDLRKERREQIRFFRLAEIDGAGCNRACVVTLVLARRKHPAERVVGVLTLLVLLRGVVGMANVLGSHYLLHVWRKDRAARLFERKFSTPVDAVLLQQVHCFGTMPLVHTGHLGI